MSRQKLGTILEENNYKKHFIDSHDFWHLKLTLKFRFTTDYQMVSPISNSESTNICLISLSTGKLRKKNILDQKEVCFIFQLLKLGKIHWKNLWNKFVKISDEFVNRFNNFSSLFQTFKVYLSRAWSSK